MPSISISTGPINQPKIVGVSGAPVNQSKLAPQPSAKPVNQPKITAVANKPVNQPTISGVAGKPQGQQETLPMSYGHVTDSIMAAQARGADASSILQAIMQQNPEKQGVFQIALERGATPEQILEKIMEDNAVDQVFPSEPEGAKGLKGFVVGAAKGAGNTLNTISKVGQIGLQKITGIKQDVAQIDKEHVTPRGTAEKIGYGAEQVAEFFVPSGTISKGAKAIKEAGAISKLPKAIQGVTKLAGRAALEGAGAAAVTAIQGGSKKDIKTAGALGAGFSVVAKGIEKIIQKVPETAWSSILKRTPTDAAKNPKLTAQAAETGLTGLTRQSIANKAGRAIQSIEVSLDDLLSKSEGTISTAKVAGYLNDLRTSYAAIPGERASVKAIDDIASQLLESFKQGKAMTLLEANQLKRNIYSVIAKSYGKGMFELPVKTEAQKLVAAGLKREIEKVIPEVKTLNEKQAVYLQIKKALDKTIARTEGKGIAGTGIGMYDVLIGGLGTGAGALAGNPLLGIGAVAVKKTAESPAVLSATAKLLNYFNQLSPTKKLLFYQAMKGLTVKSGVGINKAVSQPE